ncbi:MAG TPA: PAS domain S-box protein [Geothermobacteraceae bacterium]|nr:PAS domain S-box protein [Geothermobacteraceae bacterium]
MTDQTNSSDQWPPRDILQCPLQLLDCIFNSLEDAVFVLSPDRHLLKVNQAALAIYGYSAAELADGSTAALHVDEQHYHEFDRRIQTAFQEDRVACFEFQGRRKNGDIFPTEHTVSLLKDGEGKQLGIVSVVRDITARKQAEQQLHASEQNFRVLFEHNLDAVFLTFPDGRITAANPAACAMFGRTEAELCQLGRAGVLDLGDQRLAAALEARKRTGHVHGVELTAVRGNGERFPVEIDSVIVTGDAPSAFVFLRDISERKSIEQSLQASEENYRTVVEHQTEIITRFSADGKLLFVNDACCRTFGMSREELLGRHWSPDVHPDDLPMIEEKLALLSPDNPVVIIENRVGIGSGEQRWMQFVNRGIFDSTGRLIETQVVGRDITERREILDAKYHDQKLDALGRLAGGIAHDLNNLLVPIICLSDLATTKLEAEGHPLQKAIREIQSAGNSAAKLVAQVLSFGRRQLLEKNPEDVNQIIIELQPILTPMFRSDIALSLDLASDLKCFLADRGHIEQVLINLVINACDAITGKGTVRIRTANVAGADSRARHSVSSDSGDQILIEVADTGCGISEEITGRIFDPYFTTKETGKGTGLGLSTVLGIVKQHGGDIRMTSHPGTGTSFTMTFPAIDPGKKTPTRRFQNDKSLTGTETILVVDDEEQVRKTISALLVDAGYAVITANDGPMALELFKQSGQAIDLLLTDMTMPRMNGRELIKELAELDASVPAILLSGYSQALFSEDDTEEESFIFIQKPFKPEELLFCVRSLLD